MMSKEIFGLDEAADIGRAAVACKKNKQYNLAKIYFIESGQRMNALIKQNKVPKDKIDAVAGIIKSTIAQAEECSKYFKAEIEALKKDKYCDEILKNVTVTPDSVSFDSIMGLGKAKSILRETLILPNLRPDLFTGIRSPPRGILFYGPPGNGKTYLAKAVSRECNATFINISASAMVSKWMGEGEKMMKALFHVANICQPSVIFIDEVDSLLSERKENDHEASRRLKTEFLVQFDGLNNSPTDRISLIGATNLPNMLDPAALRRFGRRILIPLPDDEAKAQIIKGLLNQVQHNMSDKDIVKVAKSLEFYSASDISNLVKEAAMEPLRSYNSTEVLGMSKYQIRAVSMKDFETARKTVPPSLTKKDIVFFIEWEKKYGGDK